MRMIGKRPSGQNPRLCTSCFTFVTTHHGGTVDKFVGDELVAMFFHLLSGDRHAETGVAAAQALLRATGDEDPGGPWVPLGAGVHTARLVRCRGPGRACRADGRRRRGEHDGPTRLPGECRRDRRDDRGCRRGGPGPGLERRILELKGKSQGTELISLRVGG